jgi:hypothetical protein
VEATTGIEHTLALWRHQTMSATMQFLDEVTQQAGNGFNQLNAPDDAKVIGDYTGLTPPFGFQNGQG